MHWRAEEGPQLAGDLTPQMRRQAQATSESYAVYAAPKSLRGPRPATATRDGVVRASGRRVARKRAEWCDPTPASPRHQIVR